MRTLVDEINGRKDFPVFDGTDEQILGWIKENLDQFELEEEFSCDVKIDEDGDITIRGDEDSMFFRIIDVEVIKL